MTKHTSLVRTVRFLITAVSLLTHLTDATDREEIFSELPVNNAMIHPLPSSGGNFQRSPEEGDNPRIADLIRLKLSLLDVLSQTPGIDPQENDTQDRLDKTKRVFCNGFTGCGGRFRGRRRQQTSTAQVGKRLLPNFMKRPFCNSYGCYNSGKKRFTETLVNNDFPQLPDFPDSSLLDKIKRLFCNDYSGCQNFGKRLTALDAAVAKAVSDELREPLPVSKLLLTKLGSNKAFPSDFDEDVESVLNNVRR